MSETPEPVWRKIVTPSNWAEALRKMDSRARELYLRATIEIEIQLVEKEAERKTAHAERKGANAATIPEAAEKMQAGIEKALPEGLHKFVKLAVAIEAAMAETEGRKMTLSNVLYGIGNAINIKARTAD